MEELKRTLEEVFKSEIIKIVISNKVKKDEKYNKIAINLKENNKNKFYQIEKFTDKQVFHENIKINEISDKVGELIFGNYKQMTAWSNNEIFDLKISKKGKIFLGKKKNDNSKIVAKGHNKEKNYILKEGMIIEPLIDLGVFTKEGKVVNSKYDKYKQINRFVEIIDDEIKKTEDIVYAATGNKTKVFRFPSGDYNQDALEYVRSLGYECIQWDVDSIDYKESGADVEYNRVMKNIKEGSIALFHNNAKYTPQNLKKIINKLTEEGYEFVTISELIYDDNYYVDEKGEQIKK